MKRFGIDVSENQPEVNWAEAKHAIGFAFIKVSEGIDFVDSLFVGGRPEAATREGVIWGGYHFAWPRPGRDGKGQAHFFVRKLNQHGGLNPGRLRGVLDIETASEGVTVSEGRRFVRNWVRTYRRLTGHNPIIYTGSFWRDFLRNPVMLARCPLWLAAYTDSWRPWTPRAWARPHIWQFTDHASCPGIPTPVDGNRFLRSEKAFRNLIIKPKGK